MSENTVVKEKLRIYLNVRSTNSQYDTAIFRQKESVEQFCRIRSPLISEGYVKNTKCASDLSALLPEIAHCAPLLPVRFL
jgi:hypothetical protein